MIDRPIHRVSYHIVFSASDEKFNAPTKFKLHPPSSTKYFRRRLGRENQTPSPRRNGSPEQEHCRTELDEDAAALECPGSEQPLVTLAVGGVNGDADGKAKG